MDSKELAEGLANYKNYVINQIYSGPIGARIIQKLKKSGANRYEVEEILSVAIMKASALIRAGRYQEKGKCEQFFQAVALFAWKEERNKKGKGIRKRWKYIEIEEEFLEILVTEQNSRSIQKEIDSAIYRQQLLKYIDQLNAREREIVKLRFFGGNQFDEIGQIMGITASHANVVNHRAMKKLNKLIGDRNNLNSDS